MRQEDTRIGSEEWKKPFPTSKFRPKSLTWQSNIMYLPMLPLNILDITLPLTDPILKFFVILTIILLAPLLPEQKSAYRPSFGLIIAGAVIGPYGINLMERDSSIILSGTAGLLYIMFLAGLEIDLGDFRRNSSKSLLFGMYTFLIPMVLGIVAGLYGLQFLDGIVGTAREHVRIAYAHRLPHHQQIRYHEEQGAVTVAVGGTIITDTLSLLVLAIIVGMATGEVDPHFGPSSASPSSCSAASSSSRSRS